jgi:hypothetical protein
LERPPIDKFIAEGRRSLTHAGSKRYRRRFAEWPVEQIAVQNLVTFSAEVEQALAENHGTNNRAEHACS